jgi:hypothetical protein
MLCPFEYFHVLLNDSIVISDEILQKIRTTLTKKFNTIEGNSGSSLRHCSGISLERLRNIMKTFQLG